MVRSRVFGISVPPPSVKVYSIVTIKSPSGKLKRFGMSTAVSFPRSVKAPGGATGSTTENCPVTPSTLEPVIIKIESLKQASSFSRKSMKLSPARTVTIWVSLLVQPFPSV